MLLQWRKMRSKASEAFSWEVESHGCKHVRPKPLCQSSACPYMNFARADSLTQRQQSQTLKRAYGHINDGSLPEKVFVVLAACFQSSGLRKSHKQQAVDSYVASSAWEPLQRRHMKAWRSRGSRVWECGLGQRSDSVQEREER